MKKTMNLLLLLLLLGSNFSCGTETRDNGKNADNGEIPHPKKLILVLCDFTNSLVAKDSNLKKNMQDALNAFPVNTEYYFYKINEDIDKAFIHDSIPAAASDIQKIDILARCQLIVDTVYHNAPRSGSTCINKSIEVLKPQIEYFMNRGTYQKIYIIILSDMLECCRWESGFINLEKNLFVDANYILKQQHMTPLCSDSSQLDIGIILTSGRLIQFDNLTRFWRVYFDSLGYHKPVYMGSDLPQDFFRY
jgi:hypothetical protein